MSDSENPDSTPSSTGPDAPDTAARKKARSRMRLKVVAIGSAVLGMIFGSVLDMFVQGAMESTGFFGPTIDEVLAEQEANFSAIQAKLAELDSASSEGERARIQDELQALVKKQEDLASALKGELASSEQELALLRENSLEKTGIATGADVWLRPGQSITVGSRDNVFSLNAIDGYRRARVTLNGEYKVIRSGEFMETPVGDEVWKVFYKQTSKGDDKSQVGFDIVPPER